jgi:hypothetical protein
MLFMIIERFKGNNMLPIYKRARDEGRMFPERLKYIDFYTRSMIVSPRTRSIT